MLLIRRNGIGNTASYTCSPIAVKFDQVGRCLLRICSSVYQRMSTNSQNVRDAEMERDSELRLSDRLNDRQVTLTRFENPPRIMITVENDLGGYCHRVIGLEDIVKMREWV